MARSDFRFHVPKRVRYSEIDAQAVVFNARYLDYLDIAMSEYFRTLRVPGGKDGLHFQFARTTLNYRKPIRFDEMIDLCVRCARIGTASITLAFEYHGAGGEDLRCEGESVIVNLAGIGAGSAPVPPAIVALFEAHEGRSLRA